MISLLFCYIATFRSIIPYLFEYVNGLLLEIFPFKLNQPHFTKLRNMTCMSSSMLKVIIWLIFYMIHVWKKIRTCFPWQNVFSKSFGDEDLGIENFIVVSEFNCGRYRLPLGFIFHKCDLRKTRDDYFEFGQGQFHILCDPPCNMKYPNHQTFKVYIIAIWLRC